MSLPPNLRRLGKQARAVITRASAFGFPVQALVETCLREQALRIALAEREFVDSRHARLVKETLEQLADLSLPDECVAAVERKGWSHAEILAFCEVYRAQIPALESERAGAVALDGAEPCDCSPQIAMARARVLQLEADRATLLAALADAVAGGES